MAYKIEKDKVKEALDEMDILENLLTERISDLYEVQGGMQSRHAYLYYRHILNTAKGILMGGLEEIEKED